MAASSSVVAVVAQSRRGRTCPDERDDGASVRTLRGRGLDRRRCRRRGASSPRPNPDDRPSRPVVTAEDEPEATAAFARPFGSSLLTSLVIAVLGSRPSACRPIAATASRSSPLASIFAVASATSLSITLSTSRFLAFAMSAIVWPLGEVGLQLVGGDAERLRDRVERLPRRCRSRTADPDPPGVAGPGPPPGPTPTSASGLFTMSSMRPCRRRPSRRSPSLMSTFCCLATSAIVVLPSLNLSCSCVGREVERLGRGVEQRRRAWTCGCPAWSRRSRPWRRRSASVGNGCAPDRPGTPIERAADAADGDRRHDRNRPSPTDCASCCIPSNASGRRILAPEPGIGLGARRTPGGNPRSEPRTAVAQDRVPPFSRG